MDAGIAKALADGRLKKSPLKSETLSEDTKMELDALGWRATKADQEDIILAVVLVTSALQGDLLNDGHIKQFANKFAVSPGIMAVRLGQIFTL